MTTARTTAPVPTAPTARRITASAALATAIVLMSAGTAAAHVSVDPGQAEQGGYSTVDFKVPNERDEASTVELEVNLPVEHPLTSVQPQPVPGWDIEVTTSKLDEPIERHGTQINEAVTKITWSGGKIEPDRFQQFPVSMGALPQDTDRLVFKTLQTYDNGEVVRWIEVPKEGTEPDHPAPVLQLAAADGEGHHGGDAKSGDTPRAHTEAADTGGEHTEATADSAGGTDTTARVLAVVGILVGIAGVAFGVLAGRRRTP
jgi:periplasmic copper chaperone A